MSETAQQGTAGPAQEQPAAHEALEFWLLGELRVTRGGIPLRLPPSRKTRALLAYLLMTGRAHRRERLCSMFWDVTDDPRGALRWSLSKLRGLVDDADARRIDADRESVCFDLSSCEVDVLSLRDALQSADLEQVPLEVLAGWADRFRGELLEGLDLSDFDDYQAWCVAEREQTRKLRARILSTLARRLAAEPESALKYARSWVQVDPLNHEARLDLLKLAMAAGRRDEAAQHYESGRRLLEELGSARAPELVAAWRELKANPAPAMDAGQAPVAAVVPTSSPAANMALIGRDRECTELVALLERAERDRCEQILLLSGEPGIGKSRLLAELRRLAGERGATVLEGASYEGESGRPYGPWIDALRGLAGAGDADDGRSPLLRELDQSSEGDGGRDRLFAGVSDLIAVSAHDAPPVLLVLDDVQWLDRASAELLHYVARTSKHRPLIVVLGAREGELADNSTLARVMRSLRRDMPVAELALRPLDDGAIGSILAGTGSTLSVQRVCEQAGGNALFALELARGQTQDDALPASVADAVRDRLERLPQQSADVLRWGSVLGSAFSMDRLETLMALDMGAVVDALEVLERHALIRSTPGGEMYLFSHGLVRRVVYADLSEPRRVLMHHRVADLLQSQEDVDGSLVAAIAHHATLGHDDGLAATACARAGQRCLRLFAHEQALMLARRGLRHAEHLSEPERVQRIIELKAVQYQAQSPVDVADTVRELEALGEHALELGCQEHARRAFSVLAYLSWETGNWASARERVLQAEIATRGTDGKDRVQALAEAGRCLVLLERDLPEAHAILIEAQARGKTAGFEPCEVPDGLGMIKLHQGDLQQAEALFQRAGRIASAGRHRPMEYQAIEHAAMLELERGDHAATAV